MSLIGLGKKSVRNPLERVLLEEVNNHEVGRIAQRCHIGWAARQVHRLFNFGAVGTMSDAQLLDRFVSRRDEAAEAAFEELVIRHGPMVLRVCRSVLHDAHDAEDAFQAVFLVLANRARSIRRSGSVASWLFGVAQRVANRGKRSAARRRRARPARRGADLRKLSPGGERSRLGDPPRGDQRLARAASRTRSSSATCKG